MDAGEYYRTALKGALLSFILTTSKLDDFHTILSEFLDNWEDLWLLDLSQSGLKIEKVKAPMEALKSFYENEWKNPAAAKMLSAVEKINAERISDQNADFTIEKCPFMEFHEDLKSLDAHLDLCLFGAFLKRGAQRYMKEKKELRYSYAFNLPEKPCKLRIEK
jgi:hypothetical protein